MRSIEFITEVGILLAFFGQNFLKPLWIKTNKQKN